MAHLNLTEFYKKYIKNLNSIQDYLETLDDLLAITTNQMDELNCLELQAINKKDTTLLYFLLKNKKEPVNLEEFDKFIQVVEHVFTLFYFEVLNQNFSPSALKILGNDNSALSLAIEYFCKMYQFANKQTEDKKQMYGEMLDRWKHQVIDPLLKKGVSADKGIIAGRSILGECLINVVPGKKDDKFYPLCWQLLSHIKDINQQGKGFTTQDTALSIAIRRSFPVEFIQALIKKGADVNVLVYPHLFFKIKQPLLYFVIKNKNYFMLRFLFEHGADVNKMPEYEGNLFESHLQNEALLTPYQLAIALKDEKAIDIIVQHAKQNNINLLTDLHEKESQRECSLYFKVKGRDLELQCKNRFFQSSEKNLENIQVKYGLQVYVKHDSDRQPVNDAMNWLFEGILQSAAKQFWLPALVCLKEEVKNNKEFAIYVSEAPQEVRKNLPCTGTFLKNIYMQSGLSWFDKHIYITQIAHEVGHLFEKKKIGTEAYFKLETAIKKDLETLNLSECPNYIRERLQDDLTPYYGTQWRLTKEYFTLLLIEIPIALAVKDPLMSEGNLFNMMHHHFPATVNWYQDLCMQNNYENVQQVQNSQMEDSTEDERNSKRLKTAH